MYFSINTASKVSHQIDKAMEIQMLLDKGLDHIALWNFKLGKNLHEPILPSFNLINDIEHLAIISPAMPRCVLL